MNSDKKDVQIIIGAIRSVLMPYSMAIAKGIAPAGPAALSTINCCQSAGQSPNNNSPATSMGRANNFTPDSTKTVRVGIRTVLDLSLIHI